MTHSPSTTSLGLEFNAFLFAQVWEDPGGSPVSMVSALARLDIDPWLEAARLNGLPTPAAERRLTSLLASLPNRPVAGSELAPLAGRLLALLPRRSAPSRPMAPSELSRPTKSAKPAPNADAPIAARVGRIGRWDRWVFGLVVALLLVAAIVFGLGGFWVPHA